MPLVLCTDELLKKASEKRSVLVLVFFTRHQINVIYAKLCRNLFKKQDDGCTGACCNKLGKILCRRERRIKQQYVVFGEIFIKNSFKLVFYW
jgi:hypothetical protein